MHKVTVAYKDFFADDPEKVEHEDLYFNVNAFELAEMLAELNVPDFDEYMRAAIEKQDLPVVFKVLKMLFIAGYGRREKVGDRWRFIKKPEWLLEILPSPEFEVFYLNLSTDANFAAEFWNGLVSKELLSRAKQLQELGEVETLPTGAQGKKFSELTLKEQAALMASRVDTATTRIQQGEEISDIDKQIAELQALKNQKAANQ